MYSRAEKIINLRSTAPIVILGMHRSGTSLSTRLLQDVGVFMGDHLTTNDEPPYFQKINRNILANAGSGWSNIDKIIDRMHSQEFENRNLVWVDDLVFGKGTIARFFGDNRWQDLASNQSLEWGWKDPLNTLTFPIWMRIFPQARYIHIIRNGIDVAISIHRRTTNLKKRWWKWWWYQLRGYGSSTLNFDHCFRLWEDYVSFALEQKARIPPDQYLEMHYEDLLAEPEIQLHRLFDFLAISVDNDRLQFAISQINQGRLNNAQRAAQYREQIPELVNSPLMSRLGYQYSF